MASADSLNNDDNVAAPINDDEPTTSDSRIPVAAPSSSSQPRKGILKRSSSHGSRRDVGLDDTLFPLRVINRHSLDTTSVDGQHQRLAPSRIPKLSVTWWEANAATGDATTTSTDGHRRGGTGVLMGAEEEEEADDDEDDDDERAEDDDMEGEDESVASSTGSSQIAGTWWFGKSTRFVPHCHRRHAHGDCGGGQQHEYLTPTQRKNLEIGDLKKRLRLALCQIDDKERHLSQLRDRLNELEAMMDTNTALAETHRLMNRQKELTANYDADKRTIIDRYEAKVRQMRRETMDSRAEIVQLQLDIGRLSSNKKTVPIECCDVECNTDSIDDRLAATVAVDEIGGGVAGECINCKDTMMQMQAHHNESLAWRTKAVNLEIVLKNRLIADECGGASWAAVAADAQKYKDECDRLRQRIIELEYSAATANNNNRRRRINDDEMNDSGIVESILLPPPVVTSPIIIGDCILATCVDTRNRLRDENTDLVRRVNDQNRHIVELETDIANMQTQMNDYDNIRQQLTNKVAECDACALTIERMQTEKSTLDKAIDYLEQRCALLHHTLMDAGIIVGTDPITTGRVCVDARSAMIGRSKTVQTDLTSESLSTHEQEFHSLHDKLQRIEQEFSCQRSDLRSRFAEIQENLQLKTNLVQSLSAQLQAISREHESAAERVEAERQELNTRIAQLTAVAQRVPLLDAELQRAIADRAELESRQHRERHNFHDAMETSLNETLKQHTDQSQYWQAKLASVERQHSADRAELTKLRKVHNDTKIRLNLEKVQVEQQLQACIDQVAVLTNKVYRPMNDKEIDAKPDVVHKYVACRPISKAKATEITKGELFDETEERLKLCQGELLTTRRQVEVLQQKLIDCFQVRGNSGTDKMRDDDIDTPNLVQTNAHKIEEYKLKSLEDSNAQLRARLAQCEEEKKAISSAERERITQLVAEFDNVRNELDTEIRKYEAEKHRMKERIAKLEAIAKERDALRIKCDQMMHFEQLLTQSDQLPKFDRAELDRQLATIGDDNVSARVSFLIDKVERDAERYAHDVDILRQQQQKVQNNNNADLLTSTRSNITAIRLQRCLSDPQSLTSIDDDGGGNRSQLRMQNRLLVKDNARLTAELAEVRRTINRAISRRSTVASNDMQMSSSARSDASPGFNDLASDLNEVRADLETILHQIDNATAVTQQSNSEELVASSNGCGLRRLSWIEQQQDKDKHERDVLSKWCDSDRMRLESELTVSRQERVGLQLQLARTKADLCAMSRELDLYKNEDRARVESLVDDSVVSTRRARLVRSRSYVEFATPVMDRDEQIRWKDKAGVMFRELTRLRRLYSTSDSECRSMRQRIAMLEGELEFAKILQELQQPPTSVMINSTASIDDHMPIVRQLQMQCDQLNNDKRRLECDIDRIREQLQTTQHNCDQLRKEVDARGAQIRIMRAEQQKSIETGLNRRSHSADASIDTYQTSMDLTSINDVGGRQRSSTSLGSHPTAAQSEPDLSFRTASSPIPTSASTTLAGRLAYAEERIERAEKDNAIAQTELTMLREATRQQLNTLRSERNELKQRLNSIVNNLDQIGPSNESQLQIEYDKLEIANQTKQMTTTTKFDGTVSTKKPKTTISSTIVPSSKQSSQLTDDHVRLQFLHDAFYYFLLNRDANDHLSAIMAILDFSDIQKLEVQRKRGSSHR